MSSPLAVTQAIAQAVAEGSKLWHAWLVSRDKRRMQAAIEAAEKYIQVNQKSGQFEGIYTADQLKLLRHYARRFFAYN